MASQDVVKAREGFTVGTKDGPIRVARGQTFKRSDPIVKGRENLFVEVDDGVGRAPRTRKARSSTSSSSSSTAKAPAKRTRKAKA